MTLNKVCQAFEDWRTTRSSRSEAIPQYLWTMVQALVPHYQRSTICKALHLSGSQFKQHCIDVKLDEQSNEQNDGFATAFLPIPTTDCELILQGRRKKLSIKIPPQQLSVVLPLLEVYL